MQTIRGLTKNYMVIAIETIRGGNSSICPKGCLSFGTACTKVDHAREDSMICKNIEKSWYSNSQLAETMCYR